jgi:hypothetical protein
MNSSQDLATDQLRGLERLAKRQALALQAILRQQRAIQSPDRLYNQDNYRFASSSRLWQIGTITLTILERNGFDYDLVEDLQGYVVKLPRFAKYAQILKNSVAHKETANE